MPLAYTPDNLRAQRRVAEHHLGVLNYRFANLEKIPADVRNNHRRTILNGIEHWERRIREIDDQLALAAAAS